MATIQIDQHPTPITAAAGEAITITHVDGGTLYYGLTFDVDDDDNAGSLTLGQSFRVGPGDTRYMISFGGAVYVGIERVDVPPPLFGGASYTPDATYTVGTDPGVTFGPGASPAGAAFGIPTLIHRWGSVIVIENAIQFDAVNLNGYAWWNDALIRLPPAWFPGVPDNGGLLPPMSGARLEIGLLDSAGSSKQFDPYAEVAIGKGNSGATGVIMRSDHLNPTLFAPGDYLSFTPSATGFFVLPQGADFA